MRTGTAAGPPHAADVAVASLQKILAVALIPHNLH
jgi:hypothetical protein